MQLNPVKYGKRVGKATRLIVKEEGVGALAQGLAPTIIGYGIEGALKFGFCKFLKRIDNSFKYKTISKFQMNFSSRFLVN